MAAAFILELPIVANTIWTLIFSSNEINKPNICLRQFLAYANFSSPKCRIRQGPKKIENHKVLKYLAENF